MGSRILNRWGERERTRNGPAISRLSFLGKPFICWYLFQISSLWGCQRTENWIPMNATGKSVLKRDQAVFIPQMERSL
jgi:hypothetical protein